jgi:hypothetical protein
MAPRGPERCEGNAGKWREGDSYSAMAPRGPERLLFHPSRSENPNHQSSDYRASIGRGRGEGDSYSAMAPRGPERWEGNDGKPSRREGRERGEEVYYSSEVRLSSA